MSLNEPEPELSGPVQFGRYTVLARLGSGGMAEVLLAMFRGDHGFQKLVVLKRMHAHLASDAHFVRMFLDEARLAARLNHPNVVATSEVGEVDGVYFLAMEYLEGISLDRIARHFIQGGEGIPLAFLLRALCDVLEGLHHAHELRDYDGTPLRVVHRDVTPSNIFVTVDGVAKVLDFGIAKAAMQDEATRTGTLKGKLSYMAPEQFYPDPIDRRTDIWAMGVVIWEMCTGRRLFKAANDATTYRNIMNAEVPSVNRYRADAPRGLDAVLSRALARDREARFPDAESLRRALDVVLREELGAPSRADVADVMRHHFGDIVEENRRAVRRFAGGVDANPEPPMHLSSQGVFKPGGVLTLAPSVSGVNVRDLGIAPEPIAPARGGLGTLSAATIATGGDDGRDWDAADEGGDDNDTVQTSREELAAMGFSAAPPVAFAPVAPPRSSMPTFSEPPELAPVAFPPSALSSANLAAPLYPAAAQGFEAVPPELLAAQEAERRRAATRRRVENAIGWVILLAVIAGVGMVLYANRAWIETTVNEARTGASADRSREGAYVLRLISDPSGATVFEGGAEIGRTPLELQVSRLQVSQRPRQFLLRAPGRVDTRALVGNHPTPRAELRVVLPVAAPTPR